MSLDPTMMFVSLVPVGIGFVARLVALPTLIGADPWYAIRLAW